MHLRFRILAIVMFLLLSMGCQSEKKNSVWIYTSLYKDTIADLTPLLAKDFPGLEINWFQAGSEEIAAKVNAEILSGAIQADILISSDRFWYEEMAAQGRLHAYAIQNASEIAPEFKHPANLYSTLSIPVMVITFNSDGISPDKAPKSYKDLSLPGFASMVSSGSPLSSGTTFSTMAALQTRYGWDYFEQLKRNKIIMEGGNSAVIRRVQSKERPIGIVLLENILRLINTDNRLKIIFPEDGVVLHNNVFALTKKDSDRKTVEKLAEWFFGNQGQEAMVRSFMYSPKKGFNVPAGAPPLDQLTGKAFPFNQDFLNAITQKRNELKEKFTQIMYQ
ncbi:MAG: extracellular solute-binding protein [Bdellovibrio sp.]|nr:extracellular solute-binding protein [Bdellovibrio sp.]